MFETTRIYIINIQQKVIVLQEYTVKVLTLTYYIDTSVLLQV